MKKIAYIVAGAILATSLVGCARTTTDVADGVTQHPNGVVYYDANGNLQQADKEIFDAKTRDGIETFAGTVGVVAGIAGTALGIIALTN